MTLQNGYFQIVVYVTVLCMMCTNAKKICPLPKCASHCPGYRFKNTSTFHYETRMFVKSYYMQHSLCC